MISVIRHLSTQHSVNIVCQCYVLHKIERAINYMPPTMSWLGYIRSLSNPTDKGTCKPVHYQYYRQNSNMAPSVTIYKYSWLHHSYTQQGYIEWAATPLSYVKRKIIEPKLELGIVKWSNFA